MKYMVEVEPYNRFWGNCITNMFLTILLKKEPSYEPLIYLNGYEYSYLSQDIFHLDYTMEYYDYFGDNLFIFKRCYFTDKNDFLDEFKEMLIANSYVTLNVDLFYWNKEGAYYNKVHRSHFSFVVGFNDEENVFYVLEEDVNLNYGVQKIPVENVIWAVQSEYKSNCEDYRIIAYKYSELKPYKLDIVQILSNAQNLVKCLDLFIDKKIIVDNATLLNDESNVHFYRNEFGKISYRLRGNILLFETMESSGMIDKQLSDQLIRSINDISNKWKLVQNTFYKYYVTNRILEIDVNKRIQDLFINEKVMWLKLLQLSSQPVKQL